jgi:Sigma-70 region 2
MLGEDVTAPEPRPVPRPSSRVGATTEELFARQRDGLVRLAYLLTGSRTVAEDIVQDAFVQLHRRRADVLTPGAYLRTSVVNGSRMHHRRTSRERARFADLVPFSVQPETIVVATKKHRPLPCRILEIRDPLRGLADRPTIFIDTPTQQLSRERRQPGVTVQLHGSPWDEGGFSTPESQGDPPDERGWDLQLDAAGAVLVLVVELAPVRGAALDVVDRFFDLGVVDH